MSRGAAPVRFNDAHGPSGSTLGLALVLQASPVAFWVVKAAGATDRFWLGYKAISARSLIPFLPTERQALGRVFATGLFSNVLNPKPGLFVIASIAQFTSPLGGPVDLQMMGYGAMFAVLAAIVFTMPGAFAAQLSNGLSRRPKAVAIAHVGAGLTFIAAGLSILALDRRR